MTRKSLPSIFPTHSAQLPFFKSLQKEIDRVFDRFAEPDAPRDLMAASSDRMMPALDVAETEGTVEITAELPGVDEKDLDVSITDGVLMLKGEKSLDREEKEKDYHLVERRYGSFRRSVPLGFTPDDGKVKASFKDGVLSLSIEKPAEAMSRTHKIEIAKS